MVRTKEKGVGKKKQVELHDLISNINQSNIFVIEAQITNGVKKKFFVVHKQ